MTTTTESGGRQNMFASEPRMSYVENYEGYGRSAEKLNGRLAMLGIVSGSFLTLCREAFSSVVFLVSNHEYY